MTNKCNFIIFNIVNIVYSLFGIGLVVCGIILLGDTERMLISRLIPLQSQAPILYYLCLAIIFLGLTVIIISTTGCWATYIDSYCILSIYLFAVLVLILMEAVIGIVIGICPEYLGLTLNDEQMTDIWQRNYGVPGKEQYTAAIDLLQIKMECCGIHGGSDFGTSWWRLRDLAAPKLTVPLSCCFLNKQATKSFLDPIPTNTTLCQDAAPERHHSARYVEGCLNMLEHWLNEQKRYVLLAASMKLGIQLLLLFSLILNCNKINSNQNRSSPNNQNKNYY